MLCSGRCSVRSPRRHCPCPARDHVPTPIIYCFEPCAGARRARARFTAANGQGSVSRPPLSLSDDAARSLVQQLGPILARHAGQSRQHRPFVYDFVRAVYHATGGTYSAAFYRKLLKAYAPDRAPSTPTIETEKNLLVQELRGRGLPRAGAGSSSPASSSPPVASDDDGPPPPPTSSAPAAAAGPGTDLALQQLLGLQHHTIALVKGLAPSGLQAHIDHLTHRLRAAEAELAGARGQAARLAAELQVQQALATERAGQVATLQAAIDTQAAALAAMAVEMAGTRQFMAQAVDGVRGETRVVRERCAQLEAQMKDKEREADMYRRRALNGGAAPAAAPHDSGMRR